MRINAYRVMWIFVFFDLPTESAVERKAHAKFRKDIMSDGFEMFQFSIYMRHCASKENADVHIARVKKMLPDKGYVAMMMFTDKQFGMMQMYYGRVVSYLPSPPGQLQLF
jgi:CRISPR-associated protein Cas2